MKKFNDWWDTYCQRTSIPNNPQREELARVAFLAGQEQRAEGAPQWIESPAAQGMHVNPGDELIFRNGKHRILWTVPQLPPSMNSPRSEG